MDGLHEYFILPLFENVVRTVLGSVSQGYDRLGHNFHQTKVEHKLEDGVGSRSECTDESGQLVKQGRIESSVRQ
jgi:hypothetical protein